MLKFTRIISWLFKSVAQKAVYDFRIGLTPLSPTLTLQFYELKLPNFWNRATLFLYCRKLVVDYRLKNTKFLHSNLERSFNVASYCYSQEIITVASSFSNSSNVELFILSSRQIQDIARRWYLSLHTYLHIHVYQTIYLLTSLLFCGGSDANKVNVKSLYDVVRMWKSGAKTQPETETSLYALLRLVIL